MPTVERKWRQKWKQKNPPKYRKAVLGDRNCKRSRSSTSDGEILEERRPGKDEQKEQNGEKREIKSKK